MTPFSDPRPPRRGFARSDCRSPPQSGQLIYYRAGGASTAQTPDTDHRLQEYGTLHTTATPPDAERAPVRYLWFRRQDVDGLFALFQNNLANFALIALLMASIGFPAEFIYTRMIPGAAVAVLFGNLYYARLARRLAGANTGPTSRPSPTASRPRCSSSTRSGCSRPRSR
jgi:hypothetical protein